MANALFTLALGGTLALGVSGAAFAQDNSPSQPQTQSQTQAMPRGPMRMDPDRQLQHMTRMLGLTGDQQSQIKPLLVDRQQKMQSVFQDPSLSPQDRRTRMQSIRLDTRAKIEAVLNDQQKQTFESMQPRGRGMQGGPPQNVPQQQ